MASPVATALGTDFDSSTTAHNVVMPATINANDLLLIFFAARGDVTFTTPGGGWAIAAAKQANGTTLSTIVYKKTAVGNEDGTNVDVVTSANALGGAVAVRVTGWNAVSLTNDVVAGTPATGTSTNPNPPSAAWAWGSLDALAFTFIGTTPSAAPVSVPNYSGIGDENGGSGSTGVKAWVASRDLTADASPEDPSSGTMTSAAWVANTVVVSGVASVNATVTSVAATATALATTPVPRIAPNSVVATATALATSSGVSLALGSTAATSTSLATTPVPVVAVTSLAATATAAAAIPVIDATDTTDATVTSVAATSTALATTPVPKIDLPSATATSTTSATSPTPVIAANSVAATASALANPPGTSLSLGSTAATASALANPPLPTISIPVTAATATALATSPGLSVSQPTPAATATVQANAPLPTLIIPSAAATATTAAIAPTLLVIPGPAELSIELAHYRAILHLPNVHDVGVEIGKTYELSIAEISPIHAVEIGLGNTYALEITMSNETVYVGTQVEATGTFTLVDGGTAVDPTTVTAALRSPIGAVTQYVYNTDPEVVKDSTGVYTLSATPTAEGVWKVAFKGTGTAVVVNEETFTAIPSIFD